MRHEINNSEDLLDSRDIIARLEELEDELSSLEYDVENAEPKDQAAARELLEEWTADNTDELEALRNLTEQGSNCADWIYGAALIRDSYFREYAQQMAEEIGAISQDTAWPANHIDWDSAAEELQTDYFDVDYDGVTYWVRG